MFSTFGIVLARIFGERLSQNWIDVLIGSITAFLIIISGTVSFVLWSHRGEQKTFSGRKLTIDKDSFNERIRRQKQEKIAWRDRLRRQRQEEIEWREKQRRR
nr:hypothetical protein [Oscillochloris trichoides]